jgi:hypothetical protein
MEHYKKSGAFDEPWFWKGKLLIYSTLEEQVRAGPSVKFEIGEVLPYLLMHCRWQIDWLQVAIVIL